MARYRPASRDRGSGSTVVLASGDRRDVALQAFSLYFLLVGMMIISVTFLLCL